MTSLWCFLAFVVAYQHCLSVVNCQTGTTEEPTSAPVNPCNSNPCGKGAICEAHGIESICIGKDEPEEPKSAPVTTTGGATSTAATPIGLTTSAQGTTTGSTLPREATTTGLTTSTQGSTLPTEVTTTGGATSKAVTTTGGATSTAGCRNEDLVAISSTDTNCIKSNYQGSMADFSNAANGIIWNYQLPSLRFDWSILETLHSLRTIRFNSSVNMAYYRIVYTKDCGDVITTEALTANRIDATKFGKVSKMTFYFAPTDYSQMVSIDQLVIEQCPLRVLDECPIILNIFSMTCAQDTVTTDILDTITFNAFSISWSGSLDKPYVDLDLKCLHIKPKEFSEVKINNATGIDKVSIEIWNGRTPVTVVDMDGATTNTFDYNTDGILFGENVRGDRIRVNITPTAIDGQQLFGKITFSKLQIFCC